jgi:hypothetical protein
MDDSLCGAQAQYFSNAFSNAGDYVRLRLDVREMKARYSKRLWSSANVSKLKQAAWHARGRGFESPYLHKVSPLAGHRNLAG